MIRYILPYVEQINNFQIFYFEKLFSSVLWLIIIVFKLIGGGFFEIPTFHKDNVYHPGQCESISYWLLSKAPHALSFYGQHYFIFKT